jgi:hypothetical protein
MAKKQTNVDEGTQLEIPNNINAKEKIRTVLFYEMKFLLYR